MGIIIRMFFLIAISLRPVTLFSETSYFSKTLSRKNIRDFNKSDFSLISIRHFSKKELHEIRSRYKECRQNYQLFSRQQLKLIQNMRLADTIGKIILHQDIVLGQSQELIDFALEIANANLTFNVLEQRIVKYINKGDLIFAALGTAITREQFRIWKEKNRTEVFNSDAPFLRMLNSLSLNEHDYQKVFNAYATCIVPFKEPELNKFFKPTVCEPLPDYPHPRYFAEKVSVCQTASDKDTDQVYAYRLLINEARSVVIENNRNALERLVMAKCIAEQSLKFFTPSHHLLKSLNRIYVMGNKSPEEAFFMTTGICGNFSGLAYNIANEIGLAGQVHLAKKGMHIYLELEDHGLWYHAHPFNSKSRCHLIFFSNKPSGEEMFH